MVGAVQVSWLTETDLMALLLERLEPGFPPDAQKHAAEILAAVARSQVPPTTMPALIPCPGLVVTLVLACIPAPPLTANVACLQHCVVKLCRLRNLPIT